MIYGILNVLSKEKRHCKAKFHRNPMLERGVRPLPLPCAMIFDLDDTILSYHPVSDPAWNEVCGNFVANHAIASVAAVKEAIQTASRQYWADPEQHRRGRLDLDNARREVVKIALRELGCLREELAVRLADDYSRLHQEMIHPFPGALETLAALTRQGIKLALATNGNAAKQRYKITKFQLEQYFQVCLVEGELGFGKPDPRVFQMALDILGVTPQETWMIGDNLSWDIETPQKMGVYAVWNDFARQGLPETANVIPDRIINNICELLAC